MRNVVSNDLCAYACVWVFVRLGKVAPITLQQIRERMDLIDFLILVCAMLYLYLCLLT